MRIWFGLPKIWNSGTKVALLVGAGAIGAENFVEEVADRLQTGAAKALLGKSVLPDELPWVTGTVGLLGTRASSDMMRGCNTLLMIGTNFPYAQFLPKPGDARAVQIDFNPARLGIRYPTDVNLQGSTRDTLEAPLPLLAQKTDTTWRDKIARIEARAEETNAARNEIAGVDGINPENLFVELNRQLPANCIITSDAGTSTNWAARHLQMRRGMKWSLSGGLATMGWAVPYAIAAKFAFPDRTPIAITGDGAMQMNGMNELNTLARYAKRWADPSIVFVVASNRDLNQVTWEMRIESGSPDYHGSQQLPDVSMAASARLLGFEGIRVERSEDLAGAFECAFATRGPVVVEVMTDLNISMLPAHVTREQMLSYGNALRKGDPEAGATIAQSVKGVIAGMFAHETAERTRT
jgi:pyruvate dehydrogenase (quinone)